MPEWLREWWPALAFALTVAFAVAGWAIRTGLASRHDLDKGLRDEQGAREREIEGVETRMTRQLDDIRKVQTTTSERLLRVEGELKHLPTTEDFNQLRAGMAKVEGQLSGLEQQAAATGKAVTRIEDYLMRKPTA
jgi:hypothetical protein